MMNKLNGKKTEFSFDWIQQQHKVRKFKKFTMFLMNMLMNKNNIRHFHSINKLIMMMMMMITQLYCRNSKKNIISMCICLIHLALFMITSHHIDCCCMATDDDKWETEIFFFSQWIWFQLSYVLLDHGLGFSFSLSLYFSHYFSVSRFIVRFFFSFSPKKKRTTTDVLYGW